MISVPRLVVRFAVKLTPLSLHHCHRYSDSFLLFFFYQSISSVLSAWPRDVRIQGQLCYARGWCMSSGARASERGSAFEMHGMQRRPRNLTLTDSKKQIQFQKTKLELTIHPGHRLREDDIGRGYSNGSTAMHPLCDSTIAGMRQICADIVAAVSKVTGKK